MTIIFYIFFVIYILIFLIACLKKGFLKRNIESILLYLITTLVIWLIINSLNINQGQSALQYMSKEDFVIQHSFLLFLISSTISIIICSPIVIKIQQKKEEKIINEYEKKYKINEYQYYRDILDISPLILSKIYNRNINFDDQIVATYIYFVEKGYIKLSDDRIIITTDLNSLEKYEKIILESLTKNIEIEEIKEDYEKSLNDYLVKNDFIKLKDKKYFDSSVLLRIVFVWQLFSNFLLFIPLSAFIFLDIILFVLTIGLIASNYLYSKIYYDIYSYVRTEKSKEICAKLNGIKNYFTSFTIINNREIKEIKLYNDYILYAIIFNLKGKLNNESKEIYNNILKMINKRKKQYDKDNNTFQNKLIFLIPMFIFLIIFLTITIVGFINKIYYGALATLGFAVVLTIIIITTIKE